MDDFEEKLKTDFAWGREIAGFKVRRSHLIGQNEEYERHYSRRMMRTQVKDFSTKKFSRRIYFSEFLAHLLQATQDPLPELEASFMEAVRNRGKKSLEESVLNYLECGVSRQKTWNKNTEIKMLKMQGIRIRFIRWFLKQGSTLACCSTPESHLMALHHGAELLEAAKRIELVQSIETYLK